MPTIRYHDSAAMLDWASRHLGLPFRDDAKAIGLAGDDDLRAVVVYDGFSACDCNMHVVSDGSGHWLTRAFLSVVFAHPFLQWRLRRVTGLVPARNTRALRFDIKLGFAYEGRCRHALPDDDIIVLGLLREQCRFIPKESRHA